MGIAKYAYLVCDSDEVLASTSRNDHKSVRLCGIEVKEDTGNGEALRRKGWRMGWKVRYVNGKAYDLCPKHAAQYDEAKVAAKHEEARLAREEADRLAAEQQQMNFPPEGGVLESLIRLDTPTTTGGRWW